MSQKRRRSRSSNSSRYDKKRFKATRNEYDSYHRNGRSCRYISYDKRDHSDSRYYNKNNRYRNRKSANRRQSGNMRKDNTPIKSNRRNNKWRYNKRHDSKRRYSSRSSRRSSHYSSSRSSSRSSRSSSSSSSHSSSCSSTATSVQRSGSVPNDKDGHLMCKPGDKILNRYVVQKVLGEGTFGRVIECVDLCTGGRRVAMKVVRNVRRYRDAAKLEVNVLSTLKRNDPYNKSHCIRMLDWFHFHGHVCITFDKFGDSLFEFLKKNDFQSFDVEEVCHISYQLCKSVLFMHRNKLTHTDLKPENILFHDSTADFCYTHNNSKPLLKVRCPNIELIDFGSATFDHEHHSSVVSTRHYRAPEVVLELGWSQPCDVWSIACIIFELYTGNTLFQTHSNLEHMAMMERILGPLPSHMIRRTRRRKYFHQGRLDWDQDSSSGRYVRQHCKNLRKYMKGDSEGERLLFDLLSRMLEYNEDRRISLHEALKHPYFSGVCTTNDHCLTPPPNNWNLQARGADGGLSNAAGNDASNDAPYSRANSFISRGVYADYKRESQRYESSNNNKVNNNNNNNSNCNSKRRKKDSCKSNCRRSRCYDRYCSNDYHLSNNYSGSFKEYKDNKYKKTKNDKNGFDDDPTNGNYQGTAYEYTNGGDDGGGGYVNNSNVYEDGSGGYGGEYQTPHAPTYNAIWNNHHSNGYYNASNGVYGDAKSDVDYKYSQRYCRDSNNYCNNKR